MKNILFVLLFVFIGALLCAETYGEAIDAVLSTGSIDTINGKTSWFPNGMLDSEGDAADYITWVTMVFLYTWADWDDSASASQASKANSVNKVSGVWYEEDEDWSYVLSISKSQILNKFDTQHYYEMDPVGLYDAILDYVLSYDDVSDF